MRKKGKILLAAMMTMFAVLLIPGKANAQGAEVKLEVKNNSDITAALKKAVNDTQNTKIIIPAGTYTLGRCEITRSDVTIVATGATLNVKTKGESNPRMLFTSESSLTGITIDGGKWISKSTSGAGMRFLHSGTVTVKNCTLTGGSNAVVEISGSQKLVMDNVTVQGSKKGLDLKNISEISANKVKISNSSKEGLRLDSVKKFTFSNCAFSNNGTYGLHIVGGKYNTKNAGVFRSSKIQSNGSNGVHLENTTGVQMVDCTVDKNKNYGICLYGFKTSGGVELSCSNCTVSGNKNTGVRLDSKNYKTTAVLNNCTVKSNASNGVDVSGGKCKAVITGGTYSYNGPAKVTVSTHDTEGAGIDILNGGSVEIKNAVISNNKSCGISMFQNSSAKADIANVSISGCKITNNLRHGIAAECAFKVSNGKKVAKTKKKITGVKIQNNVITGNKNHGIMLMVNVQASLIKGNTIKNNVQCGLDVVKSTVAKSENNVYSSNKSVGVNLIEGSKVTFSKDKISSNQKNGLLTMSSTAKLTSCEVEKNKRFGIKAEKGTLTVDKCTITNNKSAGIRAEDKANVTITKNKISSNAEGISIQKKAKAKKIDGNEVKNNGNRGIYVQDSSVTSMCGNNVEGHKTRGISVTGSSSIKKIENNLLSNTGSVKEIVIEGSVQSPLKGETFSVQFTPKAGSKQITGTAGAKVSVNVEVTSGSSTKSYKGNSKTNKKFSIKVSKLKAGDKVKVSYKDKKGNIYYSEKIL